MYQLYFLFVLFLGISGFMLAFDFFDEKMGAGRLFDSSALLSGRMLLIISLLTGIFSLLRLILVQPGSIPVLGDLLPAAAGLLAALLLFSQYALDTARESGKEPANLFQSVERIFLARKSLIGIAILVLALVHFLFPAIIIL